MNLVLTSKFMWLIFSRTILKNKRGLTGIIAKKSIELQSQPSETHLMDIGSVPSVSSKVIGSVESLHTYFRGQ